MDKDQRKAVLWLLMGAFAVGYVLGAAVAFLALKGII